MSTPETGVTGAPSDPLHEALAALDAQGAAQAADRLRVRLEAAPDDVTLLTAMGLLLIRAGDTAAAVSSLERAHYLQPQDARLLFQYGEALRAAGRAEEAVLRYRAVLRLDPSFAAARERLGVEATPHPDLQPAAAPPADAPLPPEPQRSNPVRPHALAPGSGASVPARRLYFTPREAAPEEWETDLTPAFRLLCRGAAGLWAAWVLLWLGLALPTLGIAAAVSSRMSADPLLGLIAWNLGAALPAPFIILGMAGAWVEGRPFASGWTPSPRTSLRGLALCLAYQILLLLPISLLLAGRVLLPAHLCVLLALLLSAPFHSLMAPALAGTAALGFPPAAAVSAAWSAAGRRTWIHLAMMLLVGVTMGGAVGALSWGYVATLRGGGPIVDRVFETAAVALGLTLWCALVTVAGLDTSLPDLEEEPAEDIPSPSPDGSRP